MAAASPLRSNAPVDTISDAGSSESADSVSEDRVSDSGSEHVYKQSGQAMPNMFPDETRALAEAKLANFVEAAHVVALLEDNPKAKSHFDTEMLEQVKGSPKSKAHKWDLLGCWPENM
eukprot:TRINITY_DN19463_c0_g1_i2.p1 TRINITY_DN19463_c0_g1~~TRINITY_DN19463_c0_g1_i2.p1  ORF type:complete len:118 (-),score=20.14 TRINITY_DN19463_c0_g1_i2:53-406(-)